MVVSHSGIDNGIYVCIYIGIYIGICIYIGIDNDKVIIGINVRRGGGGGGGHSGKGCGNH